MEIKKKPMIHYTIYSPDYFPHYFYSIFSVLLTLDFIANYFNLFHCDLLFLFHKTWVVVAIIILLLHSHYRFFHPPLSHEISNSLWIPISYSYCLQMEQLKYICMLYHILHILPGCIAVLSCIGVATPPGVSFPLCY